VGSVQAMIDWAQEFNDPKYNNDPEFIKGTTGPYYVFEWTPGQQLVLAKKDNYWGKGKAGASHQQAADKLIFKAVIDENAVELQIKQQKIDVATAIPSQAFKRLSENETANEFYDIDFRSRDAYSYIAYNTRPDGIKHQSIFNDRDVRWAFSHVMPVDDIIRDFYNGQAKRITSPISVASKEYNTNLEPVPYNLDSAKARLDRAGWIDTDGDQVRDKLIDGERVQLKFQLSYPAPQQTITDIVQRIVSEAQKVGMEVEPNPVDFSLLGGMLAKHDFDALMVGSSSSPLPHDFKQMWSSENWNTGENFTGFGTAYTDSLIEALRSELDPVRRKRDIDRMQEILFNEQPVAFFFNSSNRMAIHKRFANSEMYEILPFVLLNNLEVEE
jgi:peptide/nickel transport system substrate-binding protein